MGLQTFGKTKNVNATRQFSFNVRLQSTPILGSGQKQRLCPPQMEFPGHSLSVVQLITLMHLVNGSGSGTEPPGQMQLNDPGVFTHNASFPQVLRSEHSLMSVKTGKKHISQGVFNESFF